MRQNLRLAIHLWYYLLSRICQNRNHCPLQLKCFHCPYRNVPHQVHLKLLHLPRNEIFISAQKVCVHWRATALISFIHEQKVTEVNWYQILPCTKLYHEHLWLRALTENQISFEFFKFLRSQKFLLCHSCFQNIRIVIQTSASPFANVHIHATYNCHLHLTSVTCCLNLFADTFNTCLVSASFWYYTFLSHTTSIITIAEFYYLHLLFFSWLIPIIVFSLFRFFTQTKNLSFMETSSFSFFSHTNTIFWTSIQSRIYIFPFRSIKNRRW